MEQPKVIARLTVLRTTVRLRLIAYGICAVVAGGVAAFLAIVLLDWLLELPPPLRMVVAAMFLMGLAGAVLRWIIRPIQARLGIDEIAARLEAHFGTLQDRLLSTVSFLERGDAGSESMMRQTIANTERIVKDIPLESALLLRPLLLRGALMCMSVAALSIILVVAPGWVHTGLYRYVYPWGRIEWPHDTSILPLTSDQTVAVGESMTVRMAVQRGLHDTLRAVVHLREPDGGTTLLAMQRDEDDNFYATIDAVTSRNPYTIRAVRRPEVVEALASIEPPPYASDRAVRVQDLNDPPIGGVKAPIGGQVEVRLRTSKPIPPDETGTEVGLRMESGGLIPLIVDPEDGRRLLSRFKVRDDIRFRIELRDADGFENRGAAEYSILATPDTPPTVTVLEPRAATDLTPMGSVSLLIRVEDDFGITRLTLEAEHIGGGVHMYPLTDRMRVVRGDDGVEAIAQYLWSVEPMSLSPGDLLIYRAVAADNRITTEGTGQVGRSTSMRIKIISDVEFDIRLRSDIVLLEARIRQAALDEAELLDQTTALLQHGDDPTALTDAQRDVVAILSARQARLVHRLRDLAGRFDRLAERMRLNHAGDEEDRHRIASLGDALGRIAAEPMTAASGSLSEAREQTGPAAAQRELHEAARLENAALEQLHALIRLMSQWGSFHELVTKTRGLLDRQNSLRTETAELGKSMLGKPVKSLTQPEAARLKRAQREQEQLADDIEQLLARMKQLAATAHRKDRTGADAINAAIRAARVHEVTKHTRSAAEAIEANRTAAATIAQKTAADAIRKMITALRDRESRELEELRKHLERAEDQIKELLEKQQALRQATHEADLISADETTFNVFTQEQRTLKRNTRLLGEELAGVERAATAARPVREAAIPMGDAEAHLSKSQPEPATAAQDEAIALLEEALDQLEELAQKTAAEALWRSFEQIREDLEEILAAQREVNTGIKKLQGAIEIRGRIRRSEARLASKLAREQAEVRGKVEARVHDFKQVPVYDWALKRVVEWMDESRGRLATRQIDDDLAAIANRIVRELEKLVGAIVETRSLPVDTDFVESDRGGGQAQGGIIRYKPVPTVAELLVLKAMQVDINGRTEGIHEALDIDNATEQQLRELTMLGEDQAEVRRLTEMVTKRARHP